MSRIGVVEAWRKIKNEKASPEFNIELGGLFGIAMGGLPLETKPGWFASRDEKERYMVTKKYGKLTDVEAADIYINLAKTLE